MVIVMMIMMYYWWCIAVMILVVHNWFCNYHNIAMTTGTIYCRMMMTIRHAIYSMLIILMMMIIAAAASMMSIMVTIRILLDNNLLWHNDNSGSTCLIQLRVLKVGLHWIALIYRLHALIPLRWLLSKCRPSISR